ncbi:MAG TPA: hypothetical protein VLG50_06505 [Candidatus Saccharimonadales bacterium]|nr:hypothetical protein [Candidatus Saccharimonadales bacterium]
MEATLHAVEYSWAVFISDDYSCLNVKEKQVCFNAILKGFASYNWPISLFYGKKTGDIVTLTFKQFNPCLPTYKYDDLHVNILLCAGSKNQPFEDLVYNQTISFGGSSIFYNKKNIQKLIEAHYHYATSVNKPVLTIDKFRHYNEDYNLKVKSIINKNQQINDKLFLFSFNEIFVYDVTIYISLYVFTDNAILLKSLPSK